jgi:hypothetical protein
MTMLLAPLVQVLALLLPLQARRSTQPTSRALFLL